ncbi:MAG TPA: NAD-dependent epimerase/dehydratase family protein [Actinomycetota bacterium]|nr:NAD-dependent epimerase/dehydratase family protein [Actinomycetota bacterium]
MNPGPWLVTGAAGFIGAAVSRALLEAGERVVAVDSFNAYYDPALKRARVGRLEECKNFDFYRLDLTDGAGTGELFARHRPSTVVHLAAQPGIARSLTDPMAYIQNNVVATMNVLEACRHAAVGHLVYASSSSVYGANSRLPFSVHDPVDHPVSLYAATKRSNELMAHTYSHQFGLPATGLRFFTVYGPWGRPDMAYYAFAGAMTRGEPITIYGDGSQQRDFTFIDDIVEGVVEVARRPPVADDSWTPEKADPATSRAPFRLYNIGHGVQVTVNELIRCLEELLGVRAVRDHQPARSADMPATHAEVGDLQEATGFRPRASFEYGINKFAEWFLEYHNP